MTRATLCLALLVAFLLATACAEPVPYGYLLPSDPELRAQAEALADLHKQLPEAKTPADWDLLQAQIEALQAMYGDVRVLIAYYGNEEFPQDEIDAAYTSLDGLHALMLQGGKQKEDRLKPLVYPVTARSVLARLYFLQADWRGVLDATVPLLGGDWAEWNGWLGWPVPVPHLLTDVALRKLGQQGLVGPSGVPSSTLCDWYNLEVDCLRWATVQLMPGDVELLKLAEERMDEAAGHLGEDFDVLRWHVAKPPELEGYDLHTREGRSAAKDRLGLEGMGDYISGLSHWSLGCTTRRTAAIRGLVTDEPNLCADYVNWVDEQCERQFVAAMDPWMNEPYNDRNRNPSVIAAPYWDDVYASSRETLLKAGLARPLAVAYGVPLARIIERDGARYAPYNYWAMFYAWQSTKVDDATGWLTLTGYMLDDSLADPQWVNRKGDWLLELLPGTRQARIFGQPYELDHPVLWERGLLMVSEEDWNALCLTKCKWDADKQMLELSGYEPHS